MTSTGEAPDEPHPGDVLLVSSDRIAAHERGRAQGSTVVVSFRRHAMWARIIGVTPDSRHRVEIIHEADEPPSEVASDPWNRCADRVPRCAGPAADSSRSASTPAA